MARRDRKDDPQERRGLESMVAQLIRKAVLSGVDRASRAQETLEGFIGENKLPKELVTAIFSQVEDTKNGLFRVVAKEVRSFLEATDLQRELQRLLTTVSFEIRTEIRFVPNDSALPAEGAQPSAGFGRPEVKSSVEVKRPNPTPPAGHAPGGSTPPAGHAPASGHTAPPYVQTGKERERDSSHPEHAGSDGRGSGDSEPAVDSERGDFDEIVPPSS